MLLLADHIPTPWLLLCWLVTLGLAGLVARKAAWHMLTDRANLNVFLAATVAVLGLWLLKAGIKPGLNFHLLGATALTLMFRPLFALLGMALVVAGIGLFQDQFAAFAANWLIMGALPVAASWLVFRLVDGLLPNHLFIYIFLNAFFGAALAVMLVGLASTAFISLSGAYSLEYLLQEYLPYYIFIAWGEAFATGMLITIMVVWRPEWVATFDDRRYLNQ